MADEAKAPGLLLGVLAGKAKKSEESSDTEAGELAVEAFWNACKAKDWKGALNAFQDLMSECDHLAEPTEDTDENDESE